MGISINPITIITRAVTRCIEIVARNITFFRSSCCQSECRGRSGEHNRKTKKSSSV